MNNSNHTILIIEDDEVLQKSLAELLTGEGYTVSVESDGVEALAVAHRSHPELILLDLNLPGMYGLSIMEDIRTKGGDWGAGVSIVILTNQNIDEKIMESVSTYTPTFYIVKAEMNLEQILENVQSVFTA
jgi:CheY-like chemotaxis protein